MSPFGKPNIAKLQRKGDVPGLIRALNDSSLKADASAAIIQLGDAAIHPLVRTLEADESWYLRWQAAELLGAMRAPQAVDTLVEMLGDDQRLIAFSRDLAEMIVSRDTDWVPVLGPLLESEWRHDDYTLAAASARALGRIGDTRAIGPLTTCLSDDNPLTRGWAEQAIRAIGGPDAERALAAKAQAGERTSATD